MHPKTQEGGARPARRHGFAGNPEPDDPQAAAMGPPSRPTGRGERANDPASDPWASRHWCPSPVRAGPLPAPSPPVWRLQGLVAPPRPCAAPPTPPRPSQTWPAHRSTSSPDHASRVTRVQRSYNTFYSRFSVGRAVLQPFVPGQALHVGPARGPMPCWAGARPRTRARALCARIRCLDACRVAP